METITPVVTTEWLHSIESLADVPTDQLQWLIDNCECRTAPDGEYIFRIGDPVKGAYIVVKGKVKLYYLQKQEIIEVGILGPKDISGALPFSRALKVSVNAKILQETTMMFL